MTTLCLMKNSGFQTGEIHGNVNISGALQIDVGVERS